MDSYIPVKLQVESREDRADLNVFTYIENELLEHNFTLHQKK